MVNVCTSCLLVALSLLLFYIQCQTISMEQRCFYAVIHAQSIFIAIMEFRMQAHARHHLMCRHWLNAVFYNREYHLHYKLLIIFSNTKILHSYLRRFPRKHNAWYIFQTACERTMQWCEILTVLSLFSSFGAFRHMGIIMLLTRTDTLHTSKQTPQARIYDESSVVCRSCA